MTCFQDPASPQGNGEFNPLLLAQTVRLLYSLVSMCKGLTSVDKAEGVRPT